MDPLRYLGANISPGTMPAAVPGAMSAAASPSLNLPSVPLPPGAIPGAPSPFLSPLMGPPDPSAMKYEAVTQSDGSVLLHIKNPDGSLGPALKIINAPKPSSVGVR